ncbi:LacI family transcriptional regulator [Pseudalgibacter alginicilyticus]|uniref:LacI family transcriptional regulator n=1 Tax=Pseudalgibacter alginicilyticus TaxID=1736674 RepID=A0A0N7HYQ7_9FLAO|nr:LacI family DNA-binding transcriptional regulator [Pseudalgibacter alginicilyticus]ALJ05926.1 LacI family transcriptional regulator [Pseudalgibacter alginicilyticus]
MGKKTTIYDIAKKLNITAATVSRALNNNPKISAATKELVLETAAKMNYEQNKLAQALKSGKSYNVGVIVPRIDSNFFASIIRGIEDELSPFGYQVIICQTHEENAKEIENIDTLLNAQVDGVLMSITKSNIESNHFNRVIKKNIPLIFFDRRHNMEGVSSVTIDDFEGGYQATKHLINQGCKHIAHYTGSHNIDIFKDRYLGYKQALEDNGIELNEDYIIQIKSDITKGAKAMKSLLKMKTPPDGLFSSSDFSALGAIQELKSQGIKVPKDFCVVGFSNEPFTKFMELSITSIDQSPLEMGKMAAQVFLEQMNNKFKIEKRIILKPKLIIRKSSLKSDA